MSKKNPDPNPKGNSTDVNEANEDFRPSFGAAVICVLSLIVFMAMSIFFFNQKMHIAMMASRSAMVGFLFSAKNVWFQPRP